MSADRASLAHRPATARSAVTNGSRLLAGTDGRTAASRRFKDLIRSFQAEFGDHLTQIEHTAIRQAAALSLRLEQLQARVVRGEQVDADEMIRASGEVRRLLESLRKRSAARKPTAPDLAAYLASKAKLEPAA